MLMSIKELIHNLVRRTCVSFKCSKLYINYRYSKLIKLNFFLSFRSVF